VSIHASDPLASAASMSEDCGGMTSAMADSATTVSGARTVRNSDIQETGWLTPPRIIPGARFHLFWSLDVQPGAH
jgi:hypothetical protein